MPISCSPLVSVTNQGSDTMMHSKQPEILVIGSFMMDLVVRTPRVPENGETIIGVDFHRFPKGKGANQAVAASRLGGKVTMAGKLGEDPTFWHLRGANCSTKQPGLPMQWGP